LMTSAPEVGQVLRRPGAGEDARQVEDADVRKGSGHGGIRQGAFRIRSTTSRRKRWVSGSRRPRARTRNRWADPAQRDRAGAQSVHVDEKGDQFAGAPSAVGLARTRAAGRAGVALIRQQRRGAGVVEARSLLAGRWASFLVAGNLVREFPPPCPARPPGAPASRRGIGGRTALDALVQHRQQRLQGSFRDGWRAGHPVATMFDVPSQMGTQVAAVAHQPRVGPFLGVADGRPRTSIASPVTRRASLQARNLISGVKDANAAAKPSSSPWV